MPARKPTVVFIWENGDAAAWRLAIEGSLGPFEMRVHPNVGNVDEIDYAMVWMPPLGDLKRYPNLKAILSIGAGVSHILRDPDVPPDVPIVRLTDETLSLDMASHALHWVLHFHRGYHLYAGQQRQGLWKRHHYPANRERRVGVLGMGEIGRVAARHLRDLGFEVAGWSRTPKSVEGVRSYSGDGSLAPFLARSDILVVILPPTPATTELLDAAALSLLPRGSFLVNIGRGEVIDDAALLAALDSGQLGGAALDVFREEPLPPSSPFWSHPKVAVTPHVGAPTAVGYGAIRIASSIRSIENGVLPDAVVDRAVGY